jgi:hypothetical protein
MFTPGAPSYVIDLNSVEAKRWSDVIAADKREARKLFDEAATVFERVPRMLRWVFAHLYQRAGGLYFGEIRAWADAVEVDVGTVTMLNCAYELSHLRWPKVFGCTAGVRWIDGLGMVHVRNLDWPLPGMGAATRVFRFRRDAREFVTVGVPGQVGVLSGMVPRAYSVTINWAPPVSFPTFEFGPTFLLRDTLEACDTYDAAVERLKSTKLSTSVFFTVCGTRKGQACVVERTATEAAVRDATDSTIVQANHHLAARFSNNNRDIEKVPQGEEEFSLEGSGLRTDTLGRALATVGLPCSLDDVSAALDLPPVLNKFTVTQMAFCPATGDVKVWRKAD